MIIAYQVGCGWCSNLMRLSLKGTLTAVLGVLNTQYKGEEDEKQKNEKDRIEILFCSHEQRFLSENF